MKRYAGLLVAVLLVFAACGGTDPASSDEPSGDAPANEDSDGAPSGENVVDRQQPGHGYASVDGLEYSFDTPGGLDCRVAADDVAFSYIIGDNEVVLGGGASIQAGEWFGSLTLRIFEDNGVTEYSAKVIDNPSAIAIDGNSVSYSGPMERYAPSSDGSLSEPEDVGSGVFSSTCG